MEPDEIYEPEPVDPRAPIWTIEALKLIWWEEFRRNMNREDINIPAEYKSVFMGYTRRRVLDIQTYEEMNTLIVEYNRMSLSEWAESYGRSEHESFDWF